MGIGALSFLMFGNVLASTPLWTLTPVAGSQTTLSVSPTGSAVVQYTVQNHSNRIKNLVITPMPGVTQTTPCQLAPGSQCILNLAISGKELPANGIKTGPALCQADINGSPIPNQCYQPSANNSLNITVDSGPSQASIIEAGSPLTLATGGAPQAITITNTSSAIAYNIKAQLVGTALNGNVIQDATNCTVVQPGTMCSLIFTPLTTAVSLTSFPIEGENTNQVRGQIQITSPAIATISVIDSPLTLQATNGTPVMGTLIIKNNSQTITATNISADISGVLATAGVTEDNSNCLANGGLAPQAMCNLVFTPGSQAVTSTSVNIKGSNTTLTSANIAVNGVPQASITILSGNPLVLDTNGSGNMVIKNNSTTEYAVGIAPNFAGTGLAGLVSVSSNTCIISPTGIMPGATCTITFNASSTTQSATSFPIQGSNTTASNGSITITVPMTYTAYIPNFGDNIVNQCALNGSGDFSTCSQQTISSAASTFSQVKAVAINSTLTTPVAYFLKEDGAAGAIYVCPLTSGGGLATCTTFTDASLNNYGYDISINLANNIIYIPNSFLSGTVAQCVTDPTTGAVASCAPVVISGAGSFLGLTYRADKSIAYISESDSSSTPVVSLIRQCVVDGSGSLTDTCTTFSDPNIIFPQSVTINTAANIAYIPGNGSIIVQCDLDSSGYLIGTCATVTDAQFNGVNKIAIVGNYALMPNPNNNNVLSCPIVDGLITTPCITTNATEASYNMPYGIAISS